MVAISRVANPHFHNLGGFGRRIIPYYLAPPVAARFYAPNELALAYPTECVGDHPYL